MEISRCDLNRWELFSSLEDDKKLEITEFFIFYVHDHGYGSLYKTLADDVYGLGWNGSETNLLGFSGKSFRMEKTGASIRVDALSGKLIKYFCVDEFVGTALDSNGLIYWWGNFDENVEKIRLPEEIPTHHRFKEVSCGVQMIAGLTLSGDVYVWGCIFGKSEFLVGLPIKLNHPVKTMSCGGHHVAMIARNGGVYTWGDGSWGQRGYRNYLRSEQLLVRRVLLDDVLSVNCGVWCTFFLTSEGQVWACGQNNDLGVDENCERDEEDDTVPRPSKVNIPPAVNDLAVAWESDLTKAAARTSSNLHTWGSTPVKNVGLPAPLITAFLGMATPHDRGLIKVSCGLLMIAGLTLSGDVYVWGSKFGNSEFLVGLPIKLNHPVKTMSCGGYHIAMVARNGGVYTWGDGSWGQRGYRNYLRCDEFLVRRVLLDDVLSVNCGVWSTYFLTSEGQVWACGQNNDLGVDENCERDEEDDTVPRPSKVNIPPAVTDLAVAWESDVTKVAARTASNLYTWGSTPVKNVGLSAPLITAFLGMATPHDRGLIKVDP